ncbi:AlbA family DNA-binding domain-containing protein [Citrobacter portucalensis]|uniref:AlbA family DNA-binding domain-containing protein n=1 Tax=Citrobacter portucalensis TaxID=1639133 RepID=UPI002B23A44E|nr:ATP-binding protein [Citrobacter portucalensis]MEB0898324.1 ATP-binding protein [Citrobacter portucalensis]
MHNLLNMLRYKSEGTDIDFKSAQYRFTNGSENDKSELLKDILAIANSWRDGTGYILLGFKDQRPNPAEVVGIHDSIDDSRIQQFVNSKVKPKLTFSYEEHLYEGKTIGIISIPKQKRPFYLTSAYGKLKSNVVYVRRGSSTDEAEPVETIAMGYEDNGRAEMKIELSLRTPDNDTLPLNFNRTYLHFTEEFPDFERPSKPLGPFDMPSVSGIYRDNRNFFREYAEYIRINKALIMLRLVLLNRSGVQLSNAKVELTIETIDSHVHVIAESDLPEKPKPTRNTLDFGTIKSGPLFNRDNKLEIIEGAQNPECHIRLGSLLPGEQASSELIAVLPEGPGHMRIRLRVLGCELATPIEQEFAVETTGDRLSLDFKGFRDYVTAEQVK